MHDENRLARQLVSIYDCKRWLMHVIERDAIPPSIWLQSMRKGLSAGHKIARNSMLNSDPGVNDCILGTTP